jgi:hypothetical protein
MDLGTQGAGNGFQIRPKVGYELDRNFAPTIKNDGPQAPYPDMTFPIIERGKRFVDGPAHSRRRAYGNSEINVGCGHQVADGEVPNVTGIDKRNPTPDKG